MATILSRKGKKLLKCLHNDVFCRQLQKTGETKSVTDAATQLDFSNSMSCDCLGRHRKTFASGRNQKIDYFLLHRDAVRAHGRPHQPTIDTYQRSFGLVDHHLTCAIGMHAAMV